MSATVLETPAWLMRGVFTYNARPGTLRLDQGRLTFREKAEGALLFDVAFEDIDEVGFPRYNFGSVMTFEVGRTRYRLALLASDRGYKWSGVRFGDIRPTRRRGKQWKEALQARRRSAAASE